MKKSVFILLTAAALLFTACADGEEGGNTSGNSSLLPQMGNEIVSGPDGNGELPQYTEIDEAAASAAMSLVSESFDSDKTETIAEGLELRTLVFGESKAYILTADLNKYSLEAATPYGLAPDGTLQSIDGQAKVEESKGAKVVAGIAANATNKGSHVPDGTIISDGKVIYTRSGNDGSIFLGLYEDNKAFACTYEEYAEIYRNKVTEMVSATHLIALNGKVLDVAGSIYKDKTCRTGGGFTADRSTLCLIYAENVDVTDLSNLLIGSGCSVGVNFNNDPELGLLCGEKLYGTEIAVGPTLLVTEK